MSDNPNLVRARHKNGTEQDVPAQWLDKDASPFPGQWTEIKTDKPKDGPTAQPPLAGDTSTSNPKGA